MSGPVEVKIGIIADFNHEGGKKIGEGILASVEAALARRKPALQRHGLLITPIWESDHGKPDQAPAAARVLDEKGCIALIGPCDSASMAAVLEETALAAIPKLATVATATPLAELGRGAAFFRFTPNDRVRVRYLIERAGDVLGRNIVVYRKSDAEHAYSTELAQDVLLELKGRGLRCKPEAVPKQHGKKPPGDVASAIICAPSQSALHIMGQLRGLHGPRLFAFGSNSALLKGDAIGLIVVADLHRDDKKPAIRDALAALDPSVSEPSIATMCAVEALINIILAS